MKTLQFRTNIAESPLLNTIESLERQPGRGFTVVTERPDHLLTVQTVDEWVIDQVPPLADAGGRTLTFWAIVPRPATRQQLSGLCPDQPAGE